MPDAIRVTRGAAARLIATTASGESKLRSRSFGYVERRVLPDASSHATLRPARDRLRLPAGMGSDDRFDRSGRPGSATAMPRGQS